MKINQDSLLLRFLKFLVERLKLRDFILRHIYYSPVLLVILTNFNRLRIKQIDLMIIIWPPAQNLAMEIGQDISKKSTVLECREFNICSAKFFDLVRSIYTVDKASQEKITYKLGRLMRDSCLIHVFWVRIYKPTMEAKDLSNHMRCREITQLKSRIREKYKSKVPNYVHDIIVHSTEAEFQNDIVAKLIVDAEMR